MGQKGFYAVKIMKSLTLNKKIAFVLAVLIVGSLLGVTIAIASDKPDGAQEAEQKAAEWIAQEEDLIAQLDAQMNILLSYPRVAEGNRSFYELSWDRATSEQREQLEAIFADDGIGLMGEWKRDVLITLGDLPADTPRLTAQDAANLYSNVEYYNIEKEFNKIAGAPDYVSMYMSVYFLNDERTEAIILELYDVHHIVFNEDGTGTRLPVGTQSFSELHPTVSVAPNIDYTVGWPETCPTPEPCPRVVPCPTAVPNIDNAVEILNPTETQVEEYYRSFYELSWDRATNEQREQLQAIFADPGIGLVGEWVRPVLIVLGDLPADTPRLTVQDAANLYGKVDFADLEKEFNKIAGAPDWIGGSGIYREIYYLNDERTEAIYLIFGDVFYFKNNEDGTQTRLPIGDQKLPEPHPTTPPSGTPPIFTPRPEVTPDPADANVLHNKDGTTTIIDLNDIKAFLEDYLRSHPTPTGEWGISIDITDLQKYSD